MKNNITRLFVLIAALGVLAALSGCSDTPNATQTDAVQKMQKGAKDPAESGK